MNELPIAVEIDSANITDNDIPIAYIYENNIAPVNAIPIQENVIIDITMDEVLMDIASNQQETQTQLQKNMHTIRLIIHVIYIICLTISLFESSPIKIHRICPQSNAWWCTLINAIYQIEFLRILLGYRPVYISIITYSLLTACFMIAMSCWIIYEWYFVTCNESIQNTFLYIMLEVEMIFSIIVLVSFVLLGCCCCIPRLITAQIERTVII